MTCSLAYPPERRLPSRRLSRAYKRKTGWFDEDTMYVILLTIKQVSAYKLIWLFHLRLQSMKSKKEFDQSYCNTA